MTGQELECVITIGNNTKAIPSSGYSRLPGIIAALAEFVVDAVVHHTANI